MDWKLLLIWILLGLVAGWLARFLLPGKIQGGMIVKLAAARAALDGGVPHVRVADGRTGAAVGAALAGAGGTQILLPDSQKARR